MADSIETIPDPTPPCAIGSIVWNSVESRNTLAGRKTRERSGSEKIASELRRGDLSFQINVNAKIVDVDLRILEWIRALDFDGATTEW